MLIEEDVARLLTEQYLTIATAETCAGRLIGARLNSVPGSSRFFPGRVIAYSGRSKTKVLGIPDELFHGPPESYPQGVLAMARTVRQMFETDMAMAESGSAGPTGGSPDRPVGTFYIGISTRDGHEEVKHYL